jgi:hypothetical protein
MPIFDAHVHYSHDAWENLPPKDAIAILRKAGLSRALVSSSGDEGTQRLATEAPDLVLPSLRPYRTRGDIATWVRDDSVVAFPRGPTRAQPVRRHRRVPSLRRRCGSAGAAADGDAREGTRSCTACSFRSDAIERIYRQDPAARILWAHSGFERPEAIRALLARHKNLGATSRFVVNRAAAAKVPAEWRALFTEFPDRFVVGTDTYTPERWHYIVEHAAWSRAWLADLPPALAERIAWRNADALFGPPPARSP